GPSPCAVRPTRCELLDEDGDVPAPQTVPVRVPVVDATVESDSEGVFARGRAHGLVRREDLERAAELRGRRAVDEARHLRPVLPVEIREPCPRPWKLVARDGDSGEIELGHHPVGVNAVRERGVAAMVVILELTRELILLRVALELEAERRLFRRVED